MENPLFLAKKVFVLAALSFSVVLTASSPTRLSQVMSTCPSNGDPCVNLDCSYWQCAIDQTYYNTSPEQRCNAVMQTYYGMLGGCPAIARCNLNLYGCQ